jgi:hypothetical protein
MDNLNVSHADANRVAVVLMKHLFGVDTEAKTTARTSAFDD